MMGGSELGFRRLGRLGHDTPFSSSVSAISNAFVYLRPAPAPADGLTVSGRGVGCREVVLCVVWEDQVLVGGGAIAHMCASASAVAWYSNGL